MAKILLNKLITKIHNRKLSREWRKQNPHNFTTLKYPIHFNKLQIGRGTYGQIEVLSYGHPDEKLCIGNYCSIAKNVRFILGGNHPLNRLSSFPFTHYFSNRINAPGLTKGSIIIGNDVWIGTGAVILSGVNVGQGAVIGAMAVVSKDIPPYAIVVGNPAQVIKFRFEQAIVDKLLAMEIFERIDEKFINDNISLFSMECDYKLLERLENIFGKK